ncbi:MAG TPA: GNAT family N-acetyltransferase [Steroidobacteraceae bacterium]|jgi:ribosomal protein S18 acetylase RimI-like enzyme
MHDYRFELAVARDAVAIASLSRRIIEAGLPPAWPADRVLCHIKRTDSVVVTARIHGLLAGFAIMQFGDTHAHLNLLAVETAHQRRGLGRRIVNWLHESALVAGTFDVGLELRANNIGAQRFYESLQYRAGDLMRGYYQGLEDARRMTRDLRVDRGLTA